MNDMESLQRTATYDGPQMGFQFPYSESGNGESHQGSGSLPAPVMMSYYQTGGDSSFSAHSFIDFSDVSVSNHDQSQANFSFDNSIDVSIPTQSNTSYQITHGSRSVATTSLGREDSTIKRMKLSRDLTKSSIKRTASVKRQSSLRIPQSRVSSNRAARSEDESLYEKTSLKRSKAIKYKIGWLSKLRALGVKIKNRVKNWRFISVKKAFNFRQRSLKKKSRTKISMPLERERAQSISELRMAIDNAPDSKFHYSGLPVSPVYRAVADVSDTNDLIETKRPPPVPRHRIASTASMQMLIDQENKLQRETTNKVLLEPMDQQHTAYNAEQDYPAHPAVVYDDSVEREVAPGLDSDNEEDKEDYDEEDDELLQELIIEKWKNYLRRVVAERIEYKLEAYRLSLIPVPSLVNHEDDTASMKSTSDFEMDDSDLHSLASTSASSAEYSSESSDTSTSYMSSTSVIPTSCHISTFDILQYQQEYMSRINDIPTAVKRSSTLPIKVKVLTEAHTEQHDRSISAV